MSNPAESYERDMVPAIFEPLSERLLELARPAPGERVRDVACGTGIVARRVAPLVGAQGQVVGSDPSPGMLEVARAAAARDGVTVDWRQASAEALPFPDASFDLIYCQQGLMFFQNRRAGLAEMRRVLVPGGRVALTVTRGLEEHPFEQRLDDALMRHAGASAMATAFSMGDADEVRGLLDGAGFEGIEIAPGTINARFAYSENYLDIRIAAIVAAIPQFQNVDSARRADIVAAIRAELEEPVRELIDADSIVNPVHFFIVQGRKAR